MSLPCGAAGADAVERLRVRRAFEAALPPLADVRRHPLRCGYRIENPWYLVAGGLGSLRHMRVTLAMSSVPLYCRKCSSIDKRAGIVRAPSCRRCLYDPIEGAAVKQRDAAHQSDTGQLCAGIRQRLQAAWEAAEWEERAAALERRDEARLAAAQAALARRLLAVRLRDAFGC